MGVVGSAEFEVRADRAKMKKDLEDAKRDLAGFTSDAEREVGGSSGRISGLIGKIGFAVTAVSAIIGAGIALAVKFGGASLEMAQTLSDSAKRIGIGTDALQEYQYVAKKTGEDAGAVSGALETFSNKLASAQAGLSKSDKDAFTALFGKDFDLRKLTDTEKALDLVLDRIAELKDPNDRAAIAERLGLGPLATAARDGAGEIAKLRDQAHDLGFVMDEDIIKKGAIAQGKLEDLADVVGIQLAEAFVGLSDEIIAFSGHLADALKGLNDFLGKYQTWKQQMGALYGENFLGDVTGANDALNPKGGWGELRAITGLISSVVSGRTANAAQIIRNGDDLASTGPIDRSALAALARSPERDDTPDLSGRRHLTPVVRTDNSAQRKAEQEARRAERVEAEINRARAEVLGIVDDEAQTVQQRYDTARAQLEAEREAEKAQLDSRLARKDLTKSEYDQLALINTQKATLEDRVASDILARDLADERLAKERALNDLTVDLLSIQASGARTASERARLERQLLQMAQKRARDDLETELSRTPGLSDDDKQARRNRLADFQNAQTRVAGEQNLTPLAAWKNQSLRDIDEVNEAYESIAANGLDALNQGIVDAIMNSKNLGDVFSNVAKQIIADLASIAVRQSITEPLANLLFGGSKGSSGSGIGSIFSSIKGLIPGFAGGVSNFGGGLAYVHAGEVLANLPSGTDVIPANVVQAMGSGSAAPMRVVVTTNDDRFNTYVDNRAAPLAVKAGAASYQATEQRQMNAQRTSRYRRGG